MDKKGKIKIAIFSFIFVAIVSVVAYAVFVLALHNANVSITPNKVLPNVLITFSVDVTHSSGDEISEVRIWHDSQGSNPNPFIGINCKPKTGWSGPILGTGSEGQFCLYIANTASDRIAASETEQFQFEATSPLTGSCRTFHFETRDTTQNPNSNVVHHFKEVCVDSEPPSTTKEFLGPKKIDPQTSVEWIDGITKVVLKAEDDEEHNSGVDKTWYVNVLAENVSDTSEQSCWNPKEVCGQYGLESPYNGENAECINKAQGWCDANWDEKYDSWEDCVEDITHLECDVDSRWRLYKGNPIPKDEESCHILQFFSVDKLGNVEDINTNCFFVDKTPPLIEKEVGEPKIPCKEVGDQSCDYYITQQTPITLTCEDQGQHPSDDVTIHWIIKVDDEGDGFLDDGAEGFQHSGEQVTFYFKENSLHELEYWCTDAVNKSSRHFFEKDKVDSEPPVIKKMMLGAEGKDWIGQCPPRPNTDDKCFVADNRVGGVSVWVEDPNPVHAVNDVSCRYEVWLDDERIDRGEFSNHTDIIFKRDSEHTLIITCRDALGNPVRDVERFLVDSEPPVTRKKLGDPHIIKEFCEEEYQQCFLNEYINSSTPVELWAMDVKIGVDKIFWRNQIVPDEYCLEPEEWCRPCGESLSCNPSLVWNEVDVDGNEAHTTFFKQKESCHLIEFYSVDEFGNTEQPKTNCVFVDNTGPEVIKEVGDPKLLVNPQCNPEFEQCDWFITRQTPISLKCNDPTPHPVDESVLYWRDYLEGTPVEQIPEFKQETSGQAIVYKEEDSRHILEAYCTDALGNKGQLDSEVFIVESQKPVITKTIVGPSYGQCPPRPNSEDTCFIDGVTEIHVNVTDPEPHPVGGVACRWAYTVDDSAPIFRGQGLGPNFIVKFPEESKHNLIIECKDGLGNRVHDEEMFIVDKTPPNVEKRFEGPYFKQETQDGLIEWISSQTKVIPIITDAGPHKSGIKEASYRTTLVHDEACRNVEVCKETEGDKSKEFTSLPLIGGSFSINKESCHLIEIMATDNVNKTNIHKQCVFVDDSAPTPIKTVNEPKTIWDGKDSVWYQDETKHCWDGTGNEIECWKVTTMTPITLDCEDQAPHPVDHEKVYFNVGLDGDDVTSAYCVKVDGELMETDKGLFCLLNEEEAPIEFFFTEESEHNLKFYCKDALGNIGPIDEEKFKVEGKAFRIWLNKKWNLISTPFKLLDDSMDEVFKDLNEEVQSLWSFDGVNWHVYTPDSNPFNDDITTMLPGDGYWILALEDAELVIGGNLISPAMTPPSKDIVAGWNLIGYYGVEGPGCDDGICTVYHGPIGNGHEAQCGLNTLGIEIFDKAFTSLWTYWEPHNPNQWKPLGKFDNLDPGAGYWLFAQEDGIYAPSTTCGDFFP